MRVCLASGQYFSFHPWISMNAHFITHKTLFRPAEEGPVLFCFLFFSITIPISQSTHCFAGLLCYLSNGVYVWFLSNVPIQTKAIWVFKASVRGLFLKCLYSSPVELLPKAPPLNKPSASNRMWRTAQGLSVHLFLSQAGFQIGISEAWSRGMPLFGLRCPAGKKI